MKTSNFSRYLTQYLTHYLPVQRNLSSNTIRSYRDTFKLLLIFCRDEKGLNIAKLTLSKLDKKCIEDYLLWLTDARGSSPSTYNQRLCAIHAFFDYVMTEEPSYMEHCKRQMGRKMDRLNECSPFQIRSSVVKNGSLPGRWLAGTCPPSCRPWRP